ASFKNALSSDSTVEDLFVEFAAARALLGPRDDGTVLPEARSLGAALALQFDWTIDWPTTARRLAPARPLAPTGSSYVLVRHAGAARGARLRLEATWEEHAAIRWLVVKLDAQGREIGRVPVNALPRDTQAQATIADVDACDAL